MTDFFFKKSSPSAFSNIFENNTKITVCVLFHVKMFDQTRYSLSIKPSYHIFFFKNSEYEQEIPQLQTADKPMAPRRRAIQQA